MQICSTQRLKGPGFLPEGVSYFPGYVDRPEARPNSLSACCEVASPGKFLKIMHASYSGDVLAENLVPTACLEAKQKRDSETMAACFSVAKTILVEFDKKVPKVFTGFKVNNIRFDQRSEVLISATEVTEEISNLIAEMFCVLMISQGQQNTSTKCVLPVINPFSADAMAFFKNSSALVCTGEPYFSAYNGSSISFTRPLLQGMSAVYSTIERVSDFKTELSKEYPISIPVSGDRDFVKVIFHQPGRSDRSEILWSISEKAAAKSRKPSTEGLPFNIAMVGFDSVSAAEFQRQQPAAYRLLMEELGGIEFSGYNIVGDGTTPCLLGLLTGSFEYELPEGRRGFKGSSYIDSWPWIFKELEEHGWVTSFAEDDIRFGTFQYRLEGFKDPPSDHYWRPFFYQDIDSLCLGQSPVHRVIMNQTSAFLKSYNGQRKFSISFIARLSHNSINQLSKAESDLVDFLKGLKADEHLNNTVFILFSDHGLRNGGLRTTHQGSLEERLPLFIMLLPNQFRVQFPEVVRNLEQNSKQLLTAFDIHQTLRHMLTYPSFIPKSNSHGLSLLDAQPSRTCKEASVPDHHCSCMSWRSLPHNTDLATRVATAVVSSINSQLDLHPAGNRSCHRHSLSLVSSLDLAEPNLDMFHFLGPQDMHGRVAGIAQYREGDMMMVECRYRVMFETRPADATFEATVLKTHDTFHVVGEVSRTNQYGSQPACLMEKYPYLRTICTCLDYVA